MTDVAGTPITYGTPTGSSSGSFVNTHSFSHNSVAGLNACLVAQMTWSINAGTPVNMTATYNGVSMLRLNETTYGTILIAQFILANPATGSNTLEFDSPAGGSTGYFSCIATTFYNVNQNQPYVVGSPQTAIGTDISVPYTSQVNIPTIPGGLVVDCLGLPNNSVVATTDTTLIKSQAGAGANGENNQSQALGTGGNKTMSYVLSASTLAHIAGFCLFPMYQGGGAMISPMLVG